MLAPILAFAASFVSPVAKIASARPARTCVVKSSATRMAQPFTYDSTSSSTVDAYSYGYPTQSFINNQGTYYSGMGGYNMNPMTSMGRTNMMYSAWPRFGQGGMGMMGNYGGMGYGGYGMGRYGMGGYGMGGMYGGYGGFPVVRPG